MTLNAIAPTSITALNVIPISCYIGHIYYLGFGRNAWHNVWINRYYDDHLSFEISELEDRAEKLRKQGTKFKIQSMPLLILEYPQNGQFIGVCPINERSSSDYDELLFKLMSYPAETFLNFMPNINNNWLLVVNLQKSEPLYKKHLHYHARSFGRGSLESLGWDDLPRTDYSAFLKFSTDIADKVFNIKVQ